MNTPVSAGEARIRVQSLGKGESPGVGYWQWLYMSKSSPGKFKDRVT